MLDILCNSFIIDKMNNKKKILVIGYGRHGKDTVCSILKEKYRMKFNSSSWFLAKNVIFPQLKDLYNYASVEDCYNDRHNHRKEWYDIIHAYCADDKARLGKEIFQEYDIYCGLRNELEFNAMKQAQIFDYTVWVDRSKHLPPESTESMTLTPAHADYIIDNNKDFEHLVNEVEHMMSRLRDIRL